MIYNQVQVFNGRELYGITELQNNEISKTYLLQIVQIVTCSIAIILYLHLATALHDMPRRWIPKQQLGEH